MWTRHQWNTWWPTQRNATRNQQRAATRSATTRQPVATSDATLATPRNATRSAAYVDTALQTPTGAEPKDYGDDDDEMTFIGQSISEMKQCQCHGS